MTAVKPKKSHPWGMRSQVKQEQAKKAADAAKKDGKK
jgi:hypothetical protein